MPIITIDVPARAASRIKSVVDTEEGRLTNNQEALDITKSKIIEWLKNWVHSKEIRGLQAAKMIEAETEADTAVSDLDGLS